MGRSLHAMTTPSAEKATVLWQKGRNYFSSFYTELAQIRSVIGDDVTFARWCVTDLHITLDVLTNVSEVLKRADRDVVKQQLANARAAERREKAQARAVAAREREQKRVARAEEAARRAAEQARIEEEKKQQERRTRDNLRKQQSRQRVKEWKMAAYDAMAKNASDRMANNIYPTDGKDQNVVPLPDAELANQIKAASARLITSRAEWIEASIELARLLHQARSRFAANDVAFGEWLDRHHILIHKNDRSALINLGQNLESMRIVLQETDRVSYRLIWRDVEKKLLADQSAEAS